MVSVDLSVFLGPARTVSNPNYGPIPNVYIDGKKLTLPQGSGFENLTIDLSAGPHKISTTDTYFDIIINTTGVRNAFRLSSNGTYIPNVNGFWFDPTTGYIKPTIIQNKSTCWFGFLVYGINAMLYDMSGNLISQGADPSAHPEYLEVPSLFTFYNIETNTVDYSNAFPPTCPVISKNVTVRGLDGQTLTGRMSVFDYGLLAGANITEPPFIENARGSQFLINVSDSTEPATITGTTALNFISAHATPPPTPIVVVPTNNAKQFMLIAKNGVNSQFILYSADYASLLSTLTNGESVSNVVDVISTGPNTLNQAIAFLDGNIPNVTPPPPPPVVNNGEQFLLTAKNGNKATFVLLTNDFQQLQAHLNTGETISQAIGVFNASPDTFVSALAFLANNTTTQQVPPPPTPTPTPNPVNNPPNPSPQPQPNPIPITSGPTISPIIIGVALAGAAGFALFMSSGKSKRKVAA